MTTCCIVSKDWTGTYEYFVRLRKLIPDVRLGAVKCKLDMYMIVKHFYRISKWLSQ